MTTKYKLSHKLAAAMTVGALTIASGEALATNQDLVNLTTNIESATGGFATMISIVAYIGGTGLAVAGIFKLKQHVDNPGQTPMKDGLMRLGAGGALLALPFITNVMQGSISNGQNNTMTFQKLDTFGQTG